MTARTSALFAGLLGVILLAVGLIADAQRPETTVQATVTPDAAIVAIPADILALEGAERLAFEAEGAIAAHTVRPVDADAWLARRTVVYVTGLPTWEELSTRKAEFITPAPSPSPSPSPSPAPDGEAAAETTEPEQAAESADDVVVTSEDHWRHTYKGQGRLSVSIASIGAGHDLVIESLDGSPLTLVELTLEREVNDGWITPLIWWATALTIAGAIALFFTLVDTRPLQRKVEEWIVSRGKRGAADAPRPGSRRARRLAGAAIPEASLEHAATDADLDEAASRSEALQADLAADPASPLTVPVAFTPDAASVPSPVTGAIAVDDDPEQKGGQA